MPDMTVLDPSWSPLAATSNARSSFQINVIDEESNRGIADEWF